MILFSQYINHPYGQWSKLICNKYVPAKVIFEYRSIVFLKYSLLKRISEIQYIQDVPLLFPTYRLHVYWILDAYEWRLLTAPLNAHKLCEL